MTARPTELPPPGSSDVLYVIDISGYVFRAYHAVAPLSAPSGEPTHATYGTVNMLSRLVDDRRPSHLAVAMDAPGRTFRDDLDPRYKAHRPAPPPDLHLQMRRCEQIVRAYGIPIFQGAGLEADDYIAALVKQGRAHGFKVVIASADKDLMQLVEEGVVFLWDAMRDKVYGPQEVVDKWGVSPDKMRDLLALVGDTSDNVPGVKGVGPKTATELLVQFGSLQGIYDNLDAVKKPKLKESLVTHRDDAFLSQQLVTLNAEAPIAFDADALRFGGDLDVDTLRSIFSELGFTRQLRMLPTTAPTAAAEPVAAAVEGKVHTLSSKAELDAFAVQVRSDKRLGFEIHTTSRDATQADVVGIALSTQPGDSFYLPLGHRYLGAPAQLGWPDVSAVLGPLWEDPTIAKVAHDAKFADVFLRMHGVHLQGVTFDTMLASYLLDAEEKHELPSVAERYAGIAMKPMELVAPKKRGLPQRGLEDVEVGEAVGYAAPFADTVLRLQQRMAPRLAEEKLDGLLRDLELPLAALLAEMEETGVLVDPDALSVLGEQMAKELTRLEDEARTLVNMPDLNLGSPKQLEAVLFDTLGLKATRRTKTGRSTDADALEAISDAHPLPGLVLEHRAIAKLKGTYVDALPRLVHPKTGRIHTRWNQAVAATGRLSSQDPNLQNIPIRTDLGRLIRRAFVAPKGSVIVSADYSQIELRILAHLSEDPVLLHSFREGEDVHVRTAMEIFGVSAQDVTDEMRRRSKTINFGVIYGMGPVALAKRLGIPRAEAAAFIEAYFRRYEGVRDFMDRTMNEARKNHQVHTLLGRLRRLPDLRSTDGQARAYAERIAQNTPIQGTAADLLKLAMVRLAKPVVPGARMVLTVHDELAFEVPEQSADEAAQKIRESMAHAMELKVPLLVEVGKGATWADAH